MSDTKFETGLTEAQIGPESDKTALRILAKLEHIARSEQALAALKSYHSNVCDNYDKALAALEARLKDEELAFNHANEVVGNLEADVAALEARSRKLEGVIYDANATLCECRGANREGCNCDVHAAHRILRAALKGAS